MEPRCPNHWVSVRQGNRRPAAAQSLQCADAHALTRWMLVLQRGGQPAVMLRGHSFSLGFSMAYSEPRTLAHPAGTEASAAVQASSRASRGSSQRRVPLMACRQRAGGGVRAVWQAGLAAGSSACERHFRLSPQARVICKGRSGGGSASSYRSDRPCRPTALQRRRRLGGRCERLRVPRHRPPPPYPPP